MENNTTGEELMADAKLIQAKALLEYFVSHLEWEVNNDPSFVGYEKYIAPNVVDDPDNPGHKKLPDGTRRGNGSEGGSLQQWIEQWAYFGYDEKVCLTVVKHGLPNEKPRGCYLQWYYTGHNIKANWDDNHITSLYLCECCETDNGTFYDEDPITTVSIKKLGLFDGKAPNTRFKIFWNKFEDLLLNNSAEDPHQDSTILEDDLHELIINNKNLILTGAPGTGKTYLAKQLAHRLVDDPDCDDDENKAKYDAQVKFVQFHPSYDYTDFVEGLRPVKSEAKDGQLGFERKDGTFKELCLAALNAQEQAQKDGVEAPAFVMIIDEINRGQVSKIFGELFFALDPDYRGKEGKVETQYKNMVPDGDKFKPGFYVPENVYVIGTMNDIDHSLEPLDFAFRRRFAWREITAEERFYGMFKGTDPFKSASDFVDNVYCYFKRINDQIESDPGFGIAYQVGPAYFLKLKNFVGDQDLNAMSDEDFNQCMEKLWNTHLKPLLAECLKVNSDTSLTLQDLETAYYGADEE